MEDTLRICIGLIDLNETRTDDLVVYRFVFHFDSPNIQKKKEYETTLFFQSLFRYFISMFLFFSSHELEHILKEAVSLLPARKLY